MRRPPDRMRLWAIPRHTAPRTPWYTFRMHPQKREQLDIDDLERELRKLRGFGGTILVTLSATAVIIAAVTLVLWLSVF